LNAAQAPEPSGFRGQGLRFRAAPREDRPSAVAND
jgi:hypothetical protein